jgi:hypothetical protein
VNLTFLSLRVNSGVFLANIVNPLLEIVNRFLSSTHSSAYEVTVFTEVDYGSLFSLMLISLTDRFFLADKSRLDVALMLINKQSSGTGQADIKVRHPLVIIELKVRLLQFCPSLRKLTLCLHSVTISCGKTTGAANSTPNSTATRRKTRSRILDVFSLSFSCSSFFPACSCLSQLIISHDRYARYWNCRRIFLTDYTSSLAFDIDTVSLKSVEAASVRLGHAICSYKDHKSAHSVYDYGPKLAIAYEAVEALCELGMVDEEVRGNSFTKG